MIRDRGLAFHYNALQLSPPHLLIFLRLCQLVRVCKYLLPHQVLGTDTLAQVKKRIAWAVGPRTSVELAVEVGPVLLRVLFVRLSQMSRWASHFQQLYIRCNQSSSSNLNNIRQLSVEAGPVLYRRDTG